MARPRVSHTPFMRKLGGKIYDQRVAQGLTRAALGKRINRCGQQIQKYEHAADHVTCEMITTIAAALNVPVAYFFDENEANTVAAPFNKLSLENSRHFRDIKDSATQYAIHNLVKVLSVHENINN